PGRSRSPPSCLTATANYSLLSRRRSVVDRGNLRVDDTEHPGAGRVVHAERDDLDTGVREARTVGHDIGTVEGRTVGNRTGPGDGILRVLRRSRGGDQAERPGEVVSVVEEDLVEGGRPDAGVPDDARLDVHGANIGSNTVIS